MEMLPAGERTTELSLAGAVQAVAQRAGARDVEVAGEGFRSPGEWWSEHSVTARRTAGAWRARSTA